MRGYIPPKDEKEKMFYRRVQDMARRAAARGDVQFTAFLNEREAELARAALCAYKDVSYTAYGGYPAAQRVMWALWSQTAPQAQEFPIKAMRVQCRRAKGLTHRDFLGALMGLGIARECVGDILVSGGCEAGCYLTPAAAAICLAELLEVGRYAADTARAEEQTDILTDGPQNTGAFFAASLRLDGILAGVLHTGRAGAEVMIRKGAVQVNHMQVDSRSFLLQHEDVLSIKGYGKYKILQTGAQSKKGRLYVEWIQY